MIPSCILAIEDESDREYMTSLYLQYQRLMYDTIIRITKDSWLAEDVLQAALEKLIDKIQLLQKLDRKRLINYIISTCKNVAFNALRYNNRHGAISFDDFGDDYLEEDSASLIEDFIIKKEEFTRLALLWERLDVKSRYLLEARYIWQKETWEIAQDIDIKPESVRMALTRARKKALLLFEE